MSENTRKRKRPSAEDAPVSRAAQVAKKRQRRAPQVQELPTESDVVTMEVAPVSPEDVYTEPVAHVPVLWADPAILDRPDCDRILTAFAQEKRRQAYVEAVQVGRRSQLTPQLLQAICYGVEQGLDDTTICAHLGINKETFKTWKQRGKDPSTGIFYALNEGLRMAKARFELTYLDVIRGIALGGEPLGELVQERKREWNNETNSYEMVVVAEKEKTRVRARNFDAAKFLLERRLPHKYGPYAQGEEESEVALERLDDSLDAIEALTNPEDTDE